MASDIAVIGFGEAGQAMARGWALPAGRVIAYDLKILDHEAAGQLRLSAANHLVHPADTIALALVSAETIFVLVPTDQTLLAAEAGSGSIRQGAIWLDGSSSSPGRKRAAADVVDAAGGQYVDMAIMAPVFPLLHRTPVLLSGAGALQAKESLVELGMVVEVVGDEIGHASAIKMIRSVLVKGIEAVTAECLLAARRAGVENAVLASFSKSDPKVDWEERTTYNLERMTRHGARRASELREVVNTLTELGVPARMSAASAIWQDQLGDCGVEITNEPLFARLDAILSSFA